MPLKPSFKNKVLVVKLRSVLLQQAAQLLNLKEAAAAYIKVRL